VGFLSALVSGASALLVRLFGFLEARSAERQREADRAAGRAAQAAEQLAAEGARLAAADAARAELERVQPDAAADPFCRD
jgi:hypothetical protein